jgi:hypothetical protein
MTISESTSPFSVLFRNLDLKTYSVGKFAGSCFNKHGFAISKRLISSLRVHIAINHSKIYRISSKIFSMFFMSYQ